LLPLPSLPRITGIATVGFDGEVTANSSLRSAKRCKPFLDLGQIPIVRSVNEGRAFPVNRIHQAIIANDQLGRTRPQAPTHAKSR
jgi:hypothetical protein